MDRDAFRQAVFARDGHRCVLCGQTAQGRRGLDAHHIMERRLFPDGGYDVDNGATLCSDLLPSLTESCHMLAERTLISPEALREKAGITRIVLPPHLYPDQPYDKWGNPVLPDGRRLKGELYEDESVQKVLPKELFLDRVKYPRTWNLPWSFPTKDDRTLSHEQVASWVGTEVVVTEKMDGENTTLYHDYLHARSLDYSPHESRNWVRNLHGKIAHLLPPSIRICGENLWAKHSIGYDALPSYFLVFSIWEGTTCLSWSDTILWCALLDLLPVPVIYQGTYTHQLVLPKQYSDGLRHEGYVIRPAGGFQMKDFPKVVGKYVRPSHVQTHGHWMRDKVVRNGIA